MAEEHKPEGGKKGKKKPRRIVTTRHDDGSYAHEHFHDDKPNEAKFAGTSQSMEDLQQHMADHFGGGGAAAPAEAEPAAGGGGGEPEPGV